MPSACLRVYAYRWSLSISSFSNSSPPTISTYWCPKVELTNVPVCEKPPYQVSETGWGEFTVQIKVTFVPEAGEKALTLQHPIKLHHWGEPIEAPPAVTAAATPSGTPAPAAAATGAEGTPANGSSAATDDIKEAKAEPDTAGQPSVPASTAGDQSKASTEASTDAATETATPAVDSAAVATPSAAPAAALPISTVASTYPVHSWQYDEIVFSDPPANFLQILEEHPPTPLPARNRRPRDQREQHDLKSGNSKKKRAISRVGSRAGTETRQGTPVTPMTPQTPVAGQVGIPGEPGSADVPLEFSLEMEKGELNKLTETRIRIVHEMDRWR